MIGILIIAHGSLGESLIGCISHVLGKKPMQVKSFAVGSSDDPSDLLPEAQRLIKSLDTGDGVLVLSDMYGATPCNLVLKLLQPDHVEGVAGVNLPMLVRVLNYRDAGIKKCLEKATSGGRDGVVRFTKTSCEHFDAKNN